MIFKRETKTYFVIKTRDFIKVLQNSITRIFHCIILLSLQKYVSQILVILILVVEFE